jgi:cell division protein FtsB
MDEHGINLERSKLQYDKINSNVKRIVEENSKISARITELEKRMVLFITNLGAAEERGR